MNTARPELSTVFDSDLQFVDRETFNEVIVEQINFYSEDEYTHMSQKLNTWDTASLNEIIANLDAFLRTNRAKELKLATNIVLDHCMVDGELDLVRVYTVHNTAEMLISYREYVVSQLGQQEQPESEED